MSFIQSHDVRGGKSDGTPLKDKNSEKSPKISKSNENGDSKLSFSKGDISPFIQQLDGKQPKMGEKSSRLGGNGDQLPSELHATPDILTSFSPSEYLHTPPKTPQSTQKYDENIGKFHENDEDTAENTLVNASQSHTPISKGSFKVSEQSSKIAEYATMIIPTYPDTSVTNTVNIINNCFPQHNQATLILSQKNTSSQQLLSLFSQASQDPYTCPALIAATSISLTNTHSTSNLHITQQNDDKTNPVPLTLHLNFSKSSQHYLCPPPQPSKRSRPRFSHQKMDIDDENNCKNKNSFLFCLDENDSSINTIPITTDCCTQQHLLTPAKKLKKIEKSSKNLSSTSSININSQTVLLSNISDSITLTPASQPRHPSDSCAKLCFDPQSSEFLLAHARHDCCDEDIIIPFGGTPDEISKEMDKLQSKWSSTESWRAKCPPECICQNGSIYSDSRSINSFKSVKKSEKSFDNNNLIPLHFTPTPSTPKTRRPIPMGSIPMACLMPSSSSSNNSNHISHQPTMTPTARKYTGTPRSTTSMLSINPKASSNNGNLGNPGHPLGGKGNLMGTPLRHNTALLHQTNDEQMEKNDDRKYDNINGESQEFDELLKPNIKRTRNTLHNNNTQVSQEWCVIGEKYKKIGPNYQRNEKDQMDNKNDQICTFGTNDDIYLPVPLHIDGICGNNDDHANPPQGSQSDSQPPRGTKVAEKKSENSNFCNIHDILGDTHSDDNIGLFLGKSAEKYLKDNRNDILVTNNTTGNIMNNITIKIDKNGTNDEDHCIPLNNTTILDGSNDFHHCFVNKSPFLSSQTTISPPNLHRTPQNAQLLPKLASPATTHLHTSKISSYQQSQHSITMIRNMSSLAPIENTIICPFSPQPLHSFRDNNGVDNTQKIHTTLLHTHTTPTHLHQSPMASQTPSCCASYTTPIHGPTQPVTTPRPTPLTSTTTYITKHPKSSWDFTATNDVAITTSPHPHTTHHFDPSDIASLDTDIFNDFSVSVSTAISQSRSFFSEMIEKTSKIVEKEYLSAKKTAELFARLEQGDDDGIDQSMKDQLLTTPKKSRYHCGTE